MKWYAVGAIAAGALLAGLLVFAVAFPVREADLGKLCATPATQPHVELRDVVATRTTLAARIVVVNPTNESYHFSGLRVDAEYHKVLRDGALDAGAHQVTEPQVVEGDRGIDLPAHGEQAFPNASFGPSIAPGRYVLAAHIDGDALCGAARVDVA